MMGLTVLLMCPAAATSAPQAAPPRVAVDLLNDPGMTMSRALPWRITIERSGAVDRTEAAPLGHPEVLPGEAAKIGALLERQGFGRLRKQYGGCPPDFGMRRISVAVRGWAHEVTLCGDVKYEQMRRRELELFLRTWYEVLRVLSPSGRVEMSPWDQAILEPQRQ